jgi:hypothetical protein
MRYNQERAEAAMQRLSELCDPLALMGWIAKKTKFGDRVGPSAWHWTEQFLRDYDRAGDLDKVKDAFALVGVTEEVDAGVWLAEHESLIQ